MDGKITIAGFDKSTSLTALKHYFGVVPDDLGLFDSLTVGEHLSLTAAIYGLDSEVSDQRTVQLLKILNLENQINTFISACSHGSRKKTALAMAVLPNPRVLFLDEPFEGLDPIVSQAVCKLLEGAARKGTTVLLTTHSLPIAERLASHLIIIDDGRIVWNSQMAEINGSLESHYFRLVGSDHNGGMEWIGL